MLVLSLMTLYFLLLLAISQELSKSDWMNPASICNASFFICSLAELYNCLVFGTEVSLHGGLLICFFVTVFDVASLFFLLYFRQMKVQRSKLNASVESTTRVRIQVPTSLVLLAVVLGVVTAVLFLKDVRSAVSGPVAGDWNSLMNSYRTASAYSGDDPSVGLSSLSNICFKLLTIFSFVYLIIGFNNIICDGFSIKDALMLLPAAFYAICQLLNGVRLGAIVFVCSCVCCIWILLSINSGWTIRITLGKFIKIVFALVFACFLFWVASWFVGREVTLGPLDYICSYIGYSFVLFDKFLQNPGVASKYFGSETFVALYSSFGRNFGFTNLVSSGNHEFRSWGSIDLGNVYTVFRLWYHDFGFGGTALFSLLTGLFYSNLYEHARMLHGGSPLSISMISYTYLSSGIFSMPLVGKLTSSLFTPTTWFLAISSLFLSEWIKRYQKRQPPMN